MRSVKIILLIICAVIMNAASADSQTLTDKQKVLLQERVLQKVEEFQSSLSKIVNTGNSHEVRKEHVALLMNLFIGKCEPYYYEDLELGTKIHSTGVKMETSSINRAYISSQKMKNYIYKLYNPKTGKSKMSYTKIVIESASAVRVDNIEPVGDHYECAAYFCQKFIGYRDGRIVYGPEVTSKKVKCYIKSIDTKTGGTVWDAKLGDIYMSCQQRSYDMRKLILACVVLAVHSIFAQTVLPDPTLEQDFAAQVKSIDEFMARFNGTETKPNVRQDSLSRRDNILSLFDFNIKHDGTSFDGFKAQLADFANTVCSWESKLELKDAQAWAEVVCSMTYGKKLCKITLLMQKESIDKIKSRWGIFSVKGLKKAGFYNDKLATISPVDHEIHFMSLTDFFQANKQLAPALRNKNKVIDELSMFAGMVIGGYLKFVSVDDVKFHFLAVPNYSFIVEEIGRQGTNSGWLITRFQKLSDYEKEQYLNNLLGTENK